MEIFVLCTFTRVAVEQAPLSITTLNQVKKEQTKIIRNFKNQQPNPSNGFENFNKKQGKSMKQRVKPGCVHPNNKLFVFIKTRRPLHLHHHLQNPKPTKKNKKKNAEKNDRNKESTEKIRVLNTLCFCKSLFSSLGSLNLYPPSLATTTFMII